MKKEKIWPHQKGENEVKSIGGRGCTALQWTDLVQCPCFTFVQYLSPDQISCYRGREMFYWSFKAGTDPVFRESPEPKEEFSFQKFVKVPAPELRQVSFSRTDMRFWKLVPCLTRYLWVKQRSKALELWERVCVLVSLLVRRGKLRKLVRLVCSWLAGCSLVCLLVFWLVLF